jgi:ubiquitin carboxyl-terminal hydrolase 7
MVYFRSFGWESNESLTQHDAQELNRLLCDRLEEQMKGTLVEGAIERLFMGEFENYVQCIDVPYSSTRRETFYDLQVGGTVNYFFFFLVPT